MIFAQPWVLAALILLPVLWWLLRATPPAPRAQTFPAIRLLAGLRPKEETPARTPWWLLALRLAACALVIIGLAQPVLTGAGLVVSGGGTALLVIDDGWSSGADFAQRITASDAILDRLARAGRQVSLLTTAPAADGRLPSASAAMPATILRQTLDALRPKPWPSDRARATSLVAGSGPVFYVSDGVASPADAAFGRALSARGRVTELTGDAPARLLQADLAPERLIARLRQTPWPGARQEAVLAETNDGRVLSRTALSVPAGAATAEATINLPPELRNQLGALRLAGAPGAGSVALLDEAARRRPVGLVNGSTGTDTPLLGDQYYLERALGPSTELRRGTAAGLLARKLSMLVLTGSSLSLEDTAAVTSWVKQGGLLLRFASSGLAPAPDAAPAEDAPATDPLLPGRLLPGDRQLGGAMSWSQPAHLAAFPQGSPFAGLRVPAEVTVNRQVLADPSAQPAPATWASLADGTPLVTAAHLGAGELVLFHVTANADWSNLPLSGLFLDMLSRLVARSAGVAVADDARLLAPALILDGEGVLGPAARSRPQRQRARHRAPGAFPYPSSRLLRPGAGPPRAEPGRLAAGTRGHGCDPRRRAHVAGRRPAHPPDRPLAHRAGRAAALRRHAADAAPARVAGWRGPAAVAPRRRGDPAGRRTRRRQPGPGGRQPRSGHPPGLCAHRRPAGGRHLARRPCRPVGLREHPHRGGAGGPRGRGARAATTSATSRSSTSPSPRRRTARPRRWPR